MLIIFRVQNTIAISNIELRDDVYVDLGKVRARMRACACVRACVRVCVRARVRALVGEGASDSPGGRLCLTISTGCA